VLQEGVATAHPRQASGGGGAAWHRSAPARARPCPLLLRSKPPGPGAAPLCGLRCSVVGMRSEALALAAASLVVVSIPSTKHEQPVAPIPDPSPRAQRRPSVPSRRRRRCGCGSWILLAPGQVACWACRAAVQVELRAQGDIPDTKAMRHATWTKQPRPHPCASS
jgi:hypothetical protein